MSSEDIKSNSAQALTGERDCNRFSSILCQKDSQGAHDERSIVLCQKDPSGAHDEKMIAIEKETKRAIFCPLPNQNLDNNKKIYEVPKDAIFHLHLLRPSTCKTFENLCLHQKQDYFKGMSFSEWIDEVVHYSGKGQRLRIDDELMMVRERTKMRADMRLKAEAMRENINKVIEKVDEPVRKESPLTLKRILPPRPTNASEAAFKAEQETSKVLHRTKPSFVDVKSNAQHPMKETIVNMEALKKGGKSLRRLQFEEDVKEFGPDDEISSSGFMPDLKKYRDLIEYSLIGEMQVILNDVKEMYSDCFDLIDLISRWIAFFHFAISGKLKTRQDVFSLVYLTLGGNTLHMIDKTAIAAVSLGFFEAFTYFKNKKLPPPKVEFAKAEALSENLEDLSNMLDKVLDSTVTKAFETLFVSMAALHLFPKEVGMNVKAVLGKPSDSSIIGIVRSSLKALSRIVKVGELLAKGVTLKDALFAGDPLIKTQMKAEEMLLYYNNNAISEAIPVEGYIDIKEWMTTVTNCETVLETTLGKINAMSKEFTSLKKLRFDLAEAKLGMNLIVRARGRLTPFGIVLHGKPGVGKSRLLKFIGKIYARVFRVEYDESIVYTRDMTSDYWEGYDPYKHRIVYYPEVATVSRKLAETQGDDVIKELTTVIDSNAKPANMAFDSKGKVWVTPDLVLMDTNNVDMNLSVLVSNKAAFLRRFLFIEPIVKKDFRKENSCMIDTAKCNASDTLPMDKWNFKVHTYEPLDAVDSNIIHLMTGDEKDDIFALYDLLFDSILKHVAQEKRIRDGHASDDLSQYDRSRRLTSVNYTIADGALPQIVVPTPNLIHAEAKSLARASALPGDPRTCDEKEYGQDYVWIDGRWRLKTAEEMKHLEEQFHPRLNVQERAGIGVRDVQEVKQIEAPRRRMFPALSRIRDFGTGCAQAFDSVVGIMVYESIFAGYGLISKCHDIVVPEGPTFTYTEFRAVIAILVSSYLWFTGNFTMIFVLVPVIFVSGVAMLTGGTKSAIKEVRAQARGKSNELVNRLKTIVGPLRLNFALPRHYSYLAAALLAIGTLSFLFTQRKKKKEILVREYQYEKPYCWEYRDVISEDKTEFKLESEVNEPLNEIEEMVGAGRSFKRLPNKLVDSWNVQVIKQPTPHKASLEALTNKVMLNVYRVKVTTSKGCKSANIFGVCGNYALINTHLLGDMEGPVNLSLYAVGYTDTSKEEVLHHESILRKHDVFDLGEDQTLIPISDMRFYDLTMHIAPTKEYPKWGNGTVGFDPIKVFYDKEELKVQVTETTSFTLSERFAYFWENHADGMCGLPICLDRGNGFAVVGIHAAGNSMYSMGFATCIDMKTLEKGFEYMKTRPLMVIHSQSKTLGDGLEDPIPQSMVYYEDLRRLKYFGKVPGNVLLNNKSRLKLTPFYRSDKLRELFVNVYQFQTTIDYEPPVMKPIRKKDGTFISPYNINARKINVARKGLDRDVLAMVIDQMAERIIGGLKSKGVKLEPLTIDTAINGAPYDVFLRRIAASKSAGFGFPGKKSKYIPIVEETLEKVVREPNDELKKRLHEMLQEYKEGRCNGVTYRALLKDEPRDSKKVALGKTRVFFSSPIDALVLNRMFLGPLYTLIVEYPELFNAALGTDMHREAERIYKRVVEFSRLILEGDIGGLDTSIPTDATWATFSLLLRVCEELGYNELALKITQGILTDNLFPIIEVLMDILEAAGLGPSGSYATAENNTEKLEIMVRYIWFMMCLNGEIPMRYLHCFDDHVRIVLYGDDLLGSVSEEIGVYFNNITLANGFAKYLNMEFTPTQKDGVHKAFLTPEEMTFLKRNFRYSEALGRIVAPLDMNSIFKTLQWYTPSQEVNLDMQMLSMLQSSMRELYFHSSREQYDAMRIALCQIYSESLKVPLETVLSSIPMFDALTAALLPQYVGQQELINGVMGPKEATAESKEISSNERLYVARLEKELQDARSEKKLAEFDMQSVVSPAPGLHPADMRRMEIYHHHPMFRERVEKYAHLYGKVHSLDLQIKTLERLKLMRDHNCTPKAEAGIPRKSVKPPPEEVKLPLDFTIIANEMKATESSVEMIVLEMQGLLGDYDITRDFLTTRTGKCLRTLIKGADTLDICHTKILQAHKLFLSKTDVYEEYVEITLDMNIVVTFMHQACESLRTCQLSDSEKQTIDEVRFAIKRVTTEKSVMEKTAQKIYAFTSIRAQSKDLGENSVGEISASVEEKHQNVTDIGGEKTQEEDAGRLVRVNQLLKSTELPLKEFFSRPVELTALTVNLSTDVNYSVNPWASLTLIPAYRAKFKNYAFLKVDSLTIRISISASQFHYGRFLIAYIPYVALNDVANRYDGGFTALQRPNFLKYLSAVPGSFVMNPNNNEPVEFTVPYIGFTPLIRLFNVSTASLSDVTNYNDVTNLGKLYILSLNQIKSVSSSPSAVSVMVYAWLNGVELGCTTGSVGVITAEAKDERKVGPVESFAARASLLSGALSSIPFIGSFAQASHIVSNAVRDVAALFGWSLPVRAPEVTLMCSQPYGPTTANAIGWSVAQKISLDPKQELTVSPDIFGVREDELSLESMVRREALLDQFTWAHTTSPLSSQIWECLVNPCACVPVTVAGPHYYYQPSPLYFAATPFTYWRGKIIYRFEFVTAKFHKGKIGIFYEPNVAQLSLITGTITLHKQLVQVVDIQETDSIEFCVDWNFHRPWALTSAPSPNMVPVVGSPAGWSNYGNGFIFVAPVTALQSPDGSDVTVNVYIRGEDMHFNYCDPNGLPQNRSTWAQSKDLNFDRTTCNDLAPTSSDMRTLNLDFFGEEPKSFRSLLKRFHTTYTAMAGSDANTAKEIRMDLSIVPPLTPNTSTTDTQPGILSYLRYAFVGMRGSFRKRIRFLGLPTEGSFIRHVKVLLSTQSGGAFTNAVSVNVSGYSPSYEIGTATFVPTTNAAIEVEIPYYSSNLFYIAGNASPLDVSDTQYLLINLRHYTVSLESAGSNGNLIIAEETNVGEDFLLARFIAPPPFYV